MSLILCPECGHEVSTNATACPNCARPMNAPPIVERKVFVAPPADPEGGFPTWALIPIGLLGVVLIFVAYIAFRGSDETANTNLNVNVARRPTTETRSTSTVPSAGVPATAPAPPPSQTTTVPGSSTAPPVAPMPDKGTVTLNAKATTASGSTQAVRGTKFYLLEEDVETILPRSSCRADRGQHFGRQPRARGGFSCSVWRFSACSNACDRRQGKIFGYDERNRRGKSVGSGSERILPFWHCEDRTRIRTLEFTGFRHRGC